MVTAPQDAPVDVVIVGAGAVGGVLAALLAEAGKTVRVLEGGPERKLSELYSSQLWGRRLYWTDPAVEDVNRNVHFTASAGAGIGGTALHQSGLWPRFQIEDFKRHSLHGKGYDWPIDYAELRPYYDRVQADVGLSGDADAEVWRPPGAPYPLPPLHVFRQGEVLAEGFAKLDMAVSPAPLSILSRPYKGRPACSHDGWCLVGCPTGALANPLVTYIPRARQAGAQFDAGRYVTRVRTDGNGRRAIGVEYANVAGELRVQPAASVMLAAFTVENVRVLLNSATHEHPNGLANSSGLLGRYVMTHSATNVYGLFKEDLQSYLGVSTGNLYSQDRLPKYRHNAGIDGSRHWHIAPTMKPGDLLGVMMTRPDLFGDELEKFLKRAARSLSVLIGACENVPLIDNRIELSDKHDERGMRRARVIYQPSAEGRRLTQQVQEEGLAVTRAAGADEAWLGQTVSHHLLGGTRMGDNPRESVANSYGQTHDIDNLFVVGPNLFPTISHAGPTFTLHALAMRTAAYLLAMG